MKASPDGDMHIEDFSHCDYCHNREECYDETMVVDLCTSFDKDEAAYDALVQKIAENNGKNFTPGAICAGSLRPPRIVPGAIAAQNRVLKRSECAVLHLGLKSHWYRMIDSGMKKVEFREAKPYWQRRLDNWRKRMDGGKTPVLEFQTGYGRFSPRMWFIAGRGEGVLYVFQGADVPVQHKELGEFPKNRYVIFIGDRVRLVDEGEVAK